MNVTRDVIRDLLPSYFSGEATEDTRRLVDDFFRHDPDFERMAREGAQQLDSLGGVRALPPEVADEKSALTQVHRILRNQRRLFGIALTLTLNAMLFGFSFEITSNAQGEVTHVHWLQFSFQRDCVFCFGVAAAILWAVYYVRARRSRV